MTMVGLQYRCNGRMVLAPPFDVRTIEGEIHILCPECGKWHIYTNNRTFSWQYYQSISKDERECLYKDAD